jgi:hypothetical protein
LTPTTKRMNKHITTLLLILTVSFLITCCVCDLSRHYEYNVTFTDDYHMYWQLSQDSQSVAIALVCNTIGWMGIGFSTDGSMSNSEVIMTYVNSTQNGILEYRKASNGRSTPVYDSDATSKLTLVNASELDGKTVVEFIRPLNLNTGSNNRILKTDELLNVIYAYRDSDPEDDSGVYLKHQSQGTVQIRLNGEYDRPYNDTDVEKIEIRFTNNTVPSDGKTNYMCLGFRVSELIRQNNNNANTTKYHGIYYEPIIDNPNVVHHMIIYKCSKDANTVLGVNTNGTKPYAPVECESMERYCYQFAMAWAVGGLAVNLPKAAGFPLGESGTDFVSLQIHYENKEHIPNILDSSGFRIHYTKNLRPNDADILMLGRVKGIQIPPNKSSFDFTSEDCSCASQFTQPANVFAYGLHAHTLGRQVRTIQYDQHGNVIGTIGNNTDYDFNHQQVVSVSPTVTLKPSDQLITTCVYNSTGVMNITYGGHSTSDEMCLNFVFYYPAMPKKECMAWESTSTKKCVLKSNNGTPDTTDNYAKRATIAILLLVIIMGLAVFAGGVIAVFVYRRRQLKKEKGNRMHDEDVIEMTARPVDHTPTSNRTSIHIDHFDDDLHL